jgi:hypothetical protein
VPVDVIWNILSVVHYSSALNNEGIDKATGIIHKIGIVFLLEMNLSRGPQEIKTQYLDKCKKATRNWGARHCLFR